MGLPQQSMDTEVAIPYPATTKQTAAEIDGIKTDVTSTCFADKIMITISQDGRLAQWVTVPLLSDNPTQSDPYFQTISSEDDSLLPAARFTPRNLLGAANSEREMMGQLYASQIASTIVTKNPEESRSLLLGLGLNKPDANREVFLQIIELVLKVI